MSLQVKATPGEPNELIEVNVEGSKVVIEFTPKRPDEPVKADTISVTSCSEPSEYLNIFIKYWSLA